MLMAIKKKNPKQNKPVNVLEINGSICKLEDGMFFVLFFSFLFLVLSCDGRRLPGGGGQSGLYLVWLFKMKRLKAARVQ